LGLSQSLRQSCFREKLRCNPRVVGGGAQPNLNVGKVKSTLIPLPPLAEQKRIVARVERMSFILLERNGVD
jgi:restriction endonuclease S subunit